MHVVTLTGYKKIRVDRKCKVWVGDDEEPLLLWENDEIVLTVDWDFELPDGFRVKVQTDTLKARDKD